MIYRDNWLTWFYDGIEYGPKLRPNSEFDMIFKKVINRPVKSYREELLLNTQLIADTFNGPFDLMFSGGLDSEIVLRCHKELGIPINVYIFKYENNYNHADVTQALKICNELSISPTVVDFNLQKFFENEAYDIWMKGYFFNGGKLPHMKMIEYMDNTPIMADGNPYWIKDQGIWKYEVDEDCHAQSIYCKTIGRNMIADWYEYSPEVIISHMQTADMQNLINNVPTNEYKYFSELKHTLHKKLWPTINIREKRTGFEGDMKPGMNASKPEFMLEFNRQYLTGNISKHFLFTKEELITLL
jgi:hypothetical protein